MIKLRKKTSILSLSLLLLVNSVVNSYGASRTRNLEGYNWYSEKSFQQNDKLKQKKSRQAASLPENLEQNEELPEYEKNIRNLQDKHEKAHRRALDNPTSENILAELKLEKEMLRKSQIYGERRVAIAMLDSKFHDMRSHSNPLHKRVQEQIDDKENAEKLGKLSQEWGLILQVKEGCPHCHAFAPIVSEFAQEYGFQLLAASKGGNDFLGMEGVADNGQMLIFNPTRETPMLYLVKGDGKEVWPISRGINSAEQIIINIKAIDKHTRRLF